MNAKIIERLNILLKNEINSIIQYLLHSGIFEREGYYHLAEKEKHEILDETKHAQLLIKRILFLEGSPEVKEAGIISVGKTPEEMLKNDLVLEKSGISDIKETIVISDQAKDYATSKLLQDMLEEEEEHYDWLVQQLKLIDSIGIKLYLQLEAQITLL